MGNITTEQKAAPTLAEIGSFIARVRRASRAACRKQGEARRAIEALERESHKLPATLSALARASCIASTEAQCETLRRTLRHMRGVKSEIGQALMDAAPLIDACTTLAERCELLSINPADRDGLTETDGIAELVFVRGLEDSAERRRAEFNDGPLFQVAHALFAEFLRTHEGRAVTDEAFGPGGAFEALLKRPVLH